MPLDAFDVLVFWIVSILYLKLMKETISLFDRAIRKGTEILLMYEEMEDLGVVEGRLSVCHKNAGVCYNSKRDKCKHCKCYMGSKTKMKKHVNPDKRNRVEITHCPLAKWGEYFGKEAHEIEKEIANYYRKIDGKELIK